jgi:hypothetical protein
VDAAKLETGEEMKVEVALPVVITEEAYQTLQTAFPKSVNDDHSFRLLAQFLQKQP